MSSSPGDSGALPPVPETGSVSGASPTGELSRSLGLFGATMVGVGAMVGAGIFVLSGVAFRVAGPGAIYAFALNGLLTLITAFSFAELASAFPESGGGYVFAKKVFPIGGAFFAGWVLWFAYVVACALYALGFASFLAYSVEGLAGWLGHPVTVPGAVTVAVATLAIGGAGWGLARGGAGAGAGLSVAKVIAFLLLIGAGVYALSGRPPGTVRAAVEPWFPFGIAGVAQAMGYTFIALEGFEIIAAVGGEVRRPARTIPQAMLISIGVTLAIYLGLLLVMLAVGGAPGGEPAWRELGRAGEAAVAVAAARFAGPVGSVVVVVAGLLSTLSALAATLLAASRVSFSMATDRTLPRLLGRLGGPGGSPVPAVVTSAVLGGLVVVSTGRVEVAGATASLIFLVSFGLTNGMGLLVRARVGVPRGFRAPFYPVLPLVGVMACFGLALFQAVQVPIAALVALCWLGFGALTYAFWFRRSAETVSARAEALDAELIRLRGRAPLVLVPLANPARAQVLLQFGRALAPPGIGRVLAMSVARHEPDGAGAEGVEAALLAFDRAQSVLRCAAEAAASAGTPFEAVVKVHPDVSEAIAVTAAERGAEIVLLGMTRWEEGRGTALLDRLIAGTKAHVAVLEAPPHWSIARVRRVLVPVAGESSHDPLRARIVGLLLREGGREVELYRVVRTEGEVDRARRVLTRAASDLGVSEASCRVEVASDPLSAVLARASEADLIVLGLPRSEGRRTLIGGFVLRIAQEAPCPLLAIARARRR